MDLSKSFTDWNEEEIRLAIVTFTNWHNNHYFSNAVCKFGRENLQDWIKSLLPDLRDLAVLTRYSNHLILTWLKLKLIRSEGKEFIAMVGMVVDDEYWVICGERVDRIGMLRVLKDKRRDTNFTFEHHKVTRADSFEGALRIAGFTSEDVASIMPMNEVSRRRRSVNVEAQREMERNRDVT